MSTRRSVSPLNTTILAIVGARPQFIKLAPVAKALKQQKLKLVIAHTGQHHDYSMSAIFFRQLGLPACKYHLGIQGGSHGQQTGRMLEKIEEVIREVQPRMLLVFGDTNSTIAGALAAAKMHIPIAHVEAGMRSFNWEMPEEINRLVTDHLATLHFCATPTAAKNLHREGVKKNVLITGDVMADLLFSSLRTLRVSPLEKKLHLKKKKYILLTLHRPSNSDSTDHLHNLISIISQIHETVVFPIHPRTRLALDSAGLLPTLQKMTHLRMIDPVGYFDMVWLERHARAIITDSGGVQKEAYLVQVPCITLRDETEWVETVAQGWNTLTGMNAEAILLALHGTRPKKQSEKLFGDGKASQHIAKSIRQWIVHRQRLQSSLPVKL